MTPRKGCFVMRRFLQFLLFPRRTRRQARVLADLAARARPPAPSWAAGSRPVGPSVGPSVGGVWPPARHGRNAAAHHYSAAGRPSISPGQVRDRWFAERTRRGCDPTEVRAFLHLVADELAVSRAELAATRDENVRVKQALREWQSQQFRAAVPA
jgi:hypothetical protein